MARKASRTAASRQEPAPAPSPRRDLLLVLGVGGGVRLLYLLLARRTPLFDYLHLDPLYYVHWARRIAAGDVLGTEVFEQSPLYPYLLGAFFATFGERLLLLRVLQLAVGLAACAGIYLLAREVFGRREGLVAGLLAAVYGPFLYYEGQVMKSFLTYVLMTAALVLLIRPGGRPRLRLGLAGLALGLQALVRANAIVLLPALAAWTAWRARRDGDRRWASMAAAVLLGGAAAIAPVAVRNLAVAGETVLITSGGGEVFYIGNYAGANGAYLPPPFVRPAPAWEHEDFRAEARRRTGREMSRAEASRYWLGAGLDDIASDPVRWLRLEARKLALFWNARELPDNYSYAVFAGEIPLLRLAPGFGLVAPLALVGMALSYRRVKVLLPLHLVTLTYLASVLLFFNFSRFRLPVLPVLLVFAAHAAVSGWQAIRRRETGRAAAVFGAAVLLALPIHLELTASTDAPGQEEILLGYAHLDAGEAQQAADQFLAARRRIEAFRAARGTAPGLELGSACFGLGSARLDLGQAAEAVEPMRCAAELNPDDGPTLEQLAEALTATGGEAEAEAILRRRIEIPPPRFPVYFDLATLVFGRGDSAGALQIFERGRSDCPEMSVLDEADYHLGIAIVTLDGLGRPKEALPHLREVIRLAPEHAQAEEIRRQIGVIEGIP